MLRFVLANPVVAGEEFVITTAADAQNRSCDTTIEVTGPEPFAERHRQYFHDGDEVRTALDDAGFRLEAVYDGHSGRSADAETLSAAWVSRLA